MKKLFFSLFCILATLSVKGQEEYASSNRVEVARSLSYDRSSVHWKRYKILKSVGWASLGTGTLAMTGGIAGCARSDEQGVWRTAFFGGIGLIVSAIPLSFCADREKGKALVVETDYRYMQRLQAHYRKRHRTYRALSWSFLLGGTASVAGGFAGALCMYENPHSKAAEAAMGGLLVGGGCLMLGSIPMFMQAHTYKSEAGWISLQGCNLTSPLPDGSVTFQPGLSLCWSF